MPTPSFAQGSPLIVAHRGYSAKAPENTVAAFELAWSHDTGGCELDVRLTGDDQLVVIHDADTKRTGGTRLEVAKVPLAELREIDAGSWKAPEYAGERLPTLAEALATLPEQAGKRFFIEIKSGVEILPVICAELAPWQQRAQQLVVIAFDKKVTAEVKRALPWLTVLQLSSARDKLRRSIQVEDLITEACAAGLDGLNLSRDFDWTAAMVEQIHAAGLTASVWTVNDPEEAVKLARIGLDAITTDDPVLIRQALEAAGESSLKSR